MAKAKKILVVDDEQYIVRLVEVNLVRAGYEVVKAYDGVEALEAIEREKPDMVILDSRMPRMNGLDCLKAIRKNPATEGLAVIGLLEVTNAELDAVIFSWWQEGTNSAITKPFNTRELLTFIQRIFASQGEPVDEVLRDETWRTD